MGSADPSAWADDKAYKLRIYAREILQITTRSRDVPVAALFGFFANNGISENTTGWLSCCARRARHARARGARVMRGPRHATAADRHMQRAALAAVLLLALVTLASGLTGCATTKGPAGSISKVRAWWQMICDSGDSALAVAETVSRGPEVDAGAGDASASAESDAAEGGAP